jgi:hypothetical protein
MLDFLGSVEIVGLIGDEPFQFLNRRTVLANDESIMLVICVGRSAVTPFKVHLSTAVKSPHHRRGILRDIRTKRLQSR